MRCQVCSPCTDNTLKGSQRAPILSRKLVFAATSPIPKPISANTVSATQHSLRGGVQTPFDVMVP